MSKHSPLPWSKDKYGTIKDANGETLLVTGLAFPTSCVGQNNPCHANTQLLFAAPDLLEALIDLVYQVDQPNQPSWLSLDQARAAIAKARGES